MLETPEKPTEETPEAAPAQGGQGILALKAEGIIKRFIEARFQSEHGIHLESVLSTTAALAGYAALQAALALIRDGQPEAKQFPQLQTVTGKNGRTFVFCELANQLVASGGAERLTVLSLVASAGQRAGATQLPDMKSIIVRNAKFLGSDNYPPLSVPAEHVPPQNAVAALQEWWPVIMRIFSVDELRGLHPLYWMFVLAHLTGQWIEDGKDKISPDIAMVLALETAVATSKVTGIATEWPSGT